MNPFTKYIYLGIALVIAAALAAGGTFLYKAGGANVQHKWDAAVAASNLESFKTTERLQRNVDAAAKLASTRTVAIRAGVAGVQRADDGLRNALDLSERVAQESFEAAARVRATYRALLDSCRAEYKAVGEAAAGHASDSLMYQQSWPQ